MLQNKSFSTLWSRGLERSRANLKRLYLHYHNAYEDQTWMDSDLSWRNATHKVTRNFSHCYNAYDHQIWQGSDLP